MTHRPNDMTYHHVMELLISEGLEGLPMLFRCC